MMKLQSLCAGVMGMAVAISATAGPMRTTYTKENQFPAVGQTEVGALVEFIELGDNHEERRLNDANQWMIAPKARYMATKNLAMGLQVPFGGLNPDEGDSELGLGDIGLDFELRAYENLFRYPYVIPYVKVGLDTGDDDVGIGAGENSLTLGTTLGSTMYDTSWHFNLDLSYEVFDDSENIFAVGGSTVWDVSEQFALLVEAQLTDEEPPDYADEHPVRFGGGLVYSPSERLTWLVKGAGAKNSKEDVIVTFRIAYDL